MTFDFLRGQQCHHVRERSEKARLVNIVAEPVGLPESYRVIRCHTEVREWSKPAWHESLCRDHLPCEGDGPKTVRNMLCEEVSQ